MTVETLCMLIAIPIGLYAGWRMLSRTLRTMWQRVKSFVPSGPVVTSSSGVRSMPIKSISPPVFETETRGEIPREIQRNPPEIPHLDFPDPKLVERLAELVYRGKLNKTDAIQIGLQLKSGEKYQRGKAALDAAIARLDGKDIEQERDERLAGVAQAAVNR